MVLFLVILELIKKLAKEINKIFFEVIIANGFDKDALKELKSKKNLRIIDASNFSFNEILKFQFYTNNLILTQSEDNKIFSKRF